MGGQQPPSQELIRKHLYKLLSSQALEKASQQRKLLEYVVTEHLAGRKVNEYKIATHAFAKPADFTGTEDPVVRYAASHLRLSLASYYAPGGEGESDEVRIEIPKGSYNPKYHWNLPPNRTGPVVMQNAISTGIYTDNCHGKVYKTSGEYERRLLELLTTSETKHTLYIAAGTLDFFSSWLPRQMRPSAAGSQLAISNVVVLSLHPEVAGKREKSGELQPHFVELLMRNVEKLSTETGLSVEHRVWPGPHARFHGFIYDCIALLGDWSQDEKGFWHVQTPLIEHHLTHNSQRFNDFLRAFNTAAVLCKYPSVL